MAHRLLAHIYVIFGHWLQHLQAKKQRFRSSLHFRHALMDVHPLLHNFRRQQVNNPILPNLRRFTCMVSRLRKRFQGHRSRQINRNAHNTHEKPEICRLEHQALRRHSHTFSVAFRTNRR